MLDPNPAGLSLSPSLEGAVDQSREITWEEADQILSPDRFRLLKIFRGPPSQAALFSTKVKVEKYRARKRTNSAGCEDPVLGLLFAEPLSTKTPLGRPVDPADCHHDGSPWPGR
jgi:hypothetical protein